MFERNQVDSGNAGRSALVTAEITFDDGRSAIGCFSLPTSKRLFDLLNGTDHFMEFRPFGGDPEFIARTSIAAVKLLSGAPKLPAHMAATGAFDPYKVLNVKPDSSWDEVQNAYRAQSATYHPDRYASVDLPDEIAIYIEERARALNCAFAALQRAHNQVKARAENKAPVVYEKKSSISDQSQNVL
ncbi:MAG: DnaJ domain-containing protein [Pseudomonadota bacterium]